MDRSLLFKIEKSEWHLGIVWIDLQVIEYGMFRFSVVACERTRQANLESKPSQAEGNGRRSRVKVEVL